MKVGDLVAARYDEQRGLKCIGIITDMSSQAALVLWSSPSLPHGWHRQATLRVVSET